MSEEQVEHSAATHCYAVRLDVCVTGNDGISTEWTKTIRLPFAPWEGMQIRDVDGDRDPHRVDEIEWQLECGSFWAMLESEEWDSSVDAVNAEMRSNGWE